MLTRRLQIFAALLLFATSARPARGDFLRGVVISCPRAGQIWGTDEMTEALRQIVDLGADAAAIHPYAWVPTDGTIRYRPAAEVGYLDSAVERMRTVGVEILWKPHLGYWGSFDWRGAIEFGEDEAAWQRFFSTYTEFIVDQARFAERHQIPTFMVGIEYEATMHREQDWRRVIAAVREVYSGKVSYAPNWDGLDKVPFWDAVDIIGVHAYFPVAYGSNPTKAELLAGWEPHIDALNRLSEAQGKPILFAEIGYNRRQNAAREPWSYGSEDSPENRRLRRDLMEAALERIEKEPRIMGVFWWKWMPGTRSGRDFSMKEEEARETLVRYWTAGESASP